MAVGKEWRGPVEYSATIPDYSEDMEINKGRFAENREGSGLMSEWESRQTTEDTILRLWNILDDLREYAENTDEDTTEYLQALCLVYEQKFAAAYNKLTQQETT